MSDTNWYEKFSILKGGEDGFCAGLLPAPTHPTGRHRDLDVQGLQYRLCWLICLYFFYYASRPHGLCSSLACSRSLGMIKTM